MPQRVLSEDWSDYDNKKKKGVELPIFLLRGGLGSRLSSKENKETSNYNNRCRD